MRLLSHSASQALVVAGLCISCLVTSVDSAASDSVEVREVTYTSLQTEPNANALCGRGIETASLKRDGNVAVERKGCSFDQSIPGFLSDVRQVEGSGLGQAPRIFAIKNDSTLVGWGDARCGLLGNEEVGRNYRATPVEIGLRAVTQVSSGSWFSVARTGDGGVYTWGLNYEGVLGVGLGLDAPGSVSCENEYYPVGHRYRIAAAAVRPTQVSLADIVAVAADRVTAFALDRGGDVFEWGLIPTDPNPQPFGTFDTQPVPRKVDGLPASIAIVASHYMKFALGVDGTVYGWGPNVVGNFGDGTTAPRLSPTKVPNLSDVVEIAASSDSPIVAVLQDGTIRYWGGCCYLPEAPVPPWIRTVPTTPEPGNTPFYSEARGYYIGELPPIYHAKGNGGFVLLYGVDGSLYRFPKSHAEPVFVFVSALATPTSHVVAVEYHHAEFDHYFVTTNAQEIAELANGTFTGWRRTGLAFDAYRGGAGGSGVCRLFSASFGEKSSHFYTADSVECGFAKTDGGWHDEGIVFGMLLPGAAGDCPPYSEPVYRMYNGGRSGAPNHRYTKALSVRNAMLAQGWMPEGSGVLGVALCSPK